MSRQLRKIRKSTCECCGLSVAKFLAIIDGREQLICRHCKIDFEKAGTPIKIEKELKKPVYHHDIVTGRLIRV